MEPIVMRYLDDCNCLGPLGHDDTSEIRKFNKLAFILQLETTISARPYRKAYAHRETNGTYVASRLSQKL